MRNFDAHALSRDHRLDRLIERLPSSVQAAIRWLRRPSARLVRLPMGVLLCAGGILGMLPVLGFWMLPIGMLLLAEDLPPLRRAIGRTLDWLERRRPHWFTAAPPT